MKRRSRTVVLIAVVATGFAAGIAGLFALDGWLTPEPQNWSQIDDGLYMGGYVSRPPARSTAVVNLCEWDDPYHAEHHLWLPINDSVPELGLADLRELVEFIDVQRRADRATFVHCLNGVSRSGMLVTAYLMFQNQWTREQALEFVRTKRPIVRPSPPLMRLLLEWENALSVSSTPSVVE